jgi:hypothetical protein
MGAPTTAPDVHSREELSASWDGRSISGSRVLTNAFRKSRNPDNGRSRLADGCILRGMSESVTLTAVFTPDENGWTMAQLA